MIKPSWHRICWMANWVKPGYWLAFAGIICQASPVQKTGQRVGATISASRDAGQVDQLCFGAKDEIVAVEITAVRFFAAT